MTASARPPRAHADLGRVFVTSFGGFANFYILLSVMPAIARRTGSTVDAGLVTFVLTFVAVPVQLLTPRLMRRLSPRVLLVIGTGLLAVPCLGYTVSRAPAMLESMTALRGAGFGLFTVVSSLLVANIASDQTRGRAIGLYGAMAAGVGAVLPGFGLLLFHRIPADALFGIAALLGWIPALAATATWTRGPGLAESSAPRTLTRPKLLTGLVGPMLIFVPGAIAFGTIYTFPPGRTHATTTALIFTFGCAFVAGRWLAGIAADAVSDVHGVLGLSSVLAGVGMFGLAAGIWPYIAEASAGLGVGGLCTGSLVHILDRTRDRQGMAIGATVWNVTYDSGIALGGLAMGLVASGLGDAGAYLVGGCLLAAVSVPAALWDRERAMPWRAALTRQSAAR